MPVSGESGSRDHPHVFIERIEDDQAPLPPLVRGDHVARCRGVRRRSTKSRSASPSSTASTAPSTCAAGATTTRYCSSSLPATSRRSTRWRGARRAPRRSTKPPSASRPPASQGEWIEVPRDRPRLPLHRTVRSLDDAALGRHAARTSPRPHRVDLPRPPREAQQDRRRTAPARPRHDRRERRRRVRAVVRRRARLPLHGPHGPRRGAHLGVLGAHDEREVARPRRRARRLQPRRPRQPLRLLGRHPRRAAHRGRHAHGERHPIEYGPNIHGIGEQTSSTTASRRACASS